MSSIDPAGFSRDRYGNAHFARSENVDSSTKLRAVDALVIGEAHPPPGGVPGLLPSASLKDQHGDYRPSKHIITSPNTTWLPNINDDQQMVQIRVDGKFGYHDFSVWPQWYFDETRHLAFVPRKPVNISSHPHAVLWHTLGPLDFDNEPGPQYNDVGKISEALLEKLMEVRQHIVPLVKAILECPDKLILPLERYILDTAIRNIQLSYVCLAVAPQPYFKTLCIFTLFQRHALEAFACYDLVTYWSQKKIDTTNQFAAPLDTEKPVVGAITFRAEVAVELASLGVPVWFVRPLQAVRAHTIKILDVAEPVGLSSQLFAGVASVFVKDDYEPKFRGRPSAVRNRICVCLRLGHLQLGGYSGLKSVMPLASEPACYPVPYNEVATARRLPLLGDDKANKAPNINQEKFVEPTVPHWPSVVPTWLDALKNCERRWKMAFQHPDYTLMRGYALMDPYMLAKSDLAIVVWLYIRSSWISAVMTRWNAREPFPSPQNWRTFNAHVGAKIGYVWGRGSGNAVTNASGKVLDANLAQKFPLRLPDSPGAVDLFWRRQKVVTAAELASGTLSIPPHVREEIVYDLYEQNFRIELLALDRMEVFRGSMTQEGADARDLYVSNMFPGGIIVTSDLASECLGARKVKVRAVHVNNLRRVMSGWTGCSFLLDQKHKLSPNSTEEEILRLENTIFPLYCTRFFQFFCRAPTIPHVCPHRT